MTDPRPRPKYGEYAPISSTPLVPPAPAPALTPAAEPTPEFTAAPTAANRAAVPPRRTADLALTTFLLLYGVFSVVTSIGQFADLASVLTSLYVTQGLPAFTSGELANNTGIAINIIHIVLLVVTIVVALVLLRAHRRAFWVPLAGGALGIIVTIAGIASVMLSDPAFAHYVATQAP